MNSPDCQPRAATHGVDRKDARYWMSAPRNVVHAKKNQRHSDEPGESRPNGSRHDPRARTQPRELCAEHSFLCQSHNDTLEKCAEDDGR